MHDLARVHAVSRARQTLLERLVRSQPDQWPDLVRGFLRAVCRLHARHTTLTLAVVFELVEQIAQLPGGEFLRAPGEVVREIAARQYSRSTDARRLLSGLDADLTRWLTRRHPVNRADRVSRFIDDHLRESLTLDRLARLFGCSRRRLSQIYKQQTGLTVHQYIARQRLQRAEVLMRQGEKVEFAMLEVGYRNKTHFYRAFERHAGCKPGACGRRRHIDQASGPA
jgi:two-component system response regulator YesN